MTGQPSVKVNPVQNWAHIFEPIPMFSPQERRGFVRQAEGVLLQRHDQALKRERGVVGWLARFVLLPQRIREAAGLDRGSPGGRAAFGAGVFVQALVALLVATLEGYW